MRNSYEIPEVFELGRAIEEILGSKPKAPELDGILGIEWREILSNDIDESDD